MLKRKKNREVKVEKKQLKKLQEGIK